ncbi:MAG: hypothetical protein M3P51_05070 [Chloroflexota bacterium]|nr:hypothetical protein [Chloroflexota bacterium]
MQARSIISCMLFPVRFLGQQATFALGTRGKAGPFYVSMSPQPDGGTRWVTKITAALEVLERVNPMRYSFLVRGVTRFVILPRQRSVYYRETRTAYLSESLVQTRTPATIAVVLVDVSVRAEFALRTRARVYDRRAQARLTRRGALAQAGFSQRLSARGYSEGAPLYAHYRARADDLDCSGQVITESPPA